MFNSIKVVDGKLVYKDLQQDTSVSRHEVVEALRRSMSLRSVLASASDTPKASAGAAASSVNGNESSKRHASQAEIVATGQKIAYQQMEHRSRRMEGGELLVQQLRRADHDHVERLKRFDWKDNTRREPLDDCISLSSLRRLCYRAGVIRITREALAYLRSVVMKTFIDSIVSLAVTRAEHQRRHFVLAEDMQRAVAEKGIVVYGLGCYR